MSHIMANVATLEIFKDAVISHHNEEHISFWIDVQQFKRMENGHERKIAAIDIVKTFLADNASHPLTISSSIRLATLRKVHESDIPTRKVFEAAEGDVRRLLLANNWPRFVGTDSYDTCVAILRATRYFRARRHEASHQRDSASGDDREMLSTHQYISKRISGQHGSTGDTNNHSVGGHGGQEIKHRRFDSAPKSDAALEAGELGDVINFLDVDMPPYQPNPSSPHHDALSLPRLCTGGSHSPLLSIILPFFFLLCL
jgi:hypothetical protein